MRVSGNEEQVYKTWLQLHLREASAQELQEQFCPQVVLGSRCSLLAVKLALDTTSTLWLLYFLLGMISEFIFIC